MRRWFSALGSAAALVYVGAVVVAIVSMWGCSGWSCIGPWLWLALPWIDIFNPDFFRDSVPRLLNPVLPWVVVVWSYVLNAGQLYLAGWVVERALRSVVRMVLRRA